MFQLRRATSVAFAALAFAVCATAQQPPPADPAPATPTPAPPPPNILLLYADDLGFGDVSCYGATAVRTPHLDQLAAAGLRCTDAHSAAATCTPSRYALLTGEYAFRRPGTGVLPGDSKLVIDPARTTLPSLLRGAGYHTGIVGKWHLGLGAGPGEFDWNAPIAPGPLEVGFDESFVMPATGDRVPCVYVDGHTVVGLDPHDPIRVSYKQRLGDAPSGRERLDELTMKWSYGHDQTIVGGISRIGWMTGGAAARWVDADLADVLTARAERFLRENRDRRFFLEFAAHDIHVPRVPHARFRGKTAMGPRGDAIVQFDDSVGRLLAVLDELHLAEQTLVIFTSDNGPVLDDGYADGAAEQVGAHRPAGPWRGGKYSAFEGGTRVPCVVRWPGRVRPGTSAALLCQVDLLRSLAALVGRPLAAGDAPDSEDHLAAFLGEEPRGRAELVEQAGSLGLRAGKWKFVPAGKGRAFDEQTKIELGNAPDEQLYDLEKDPGETQNLAAAEPERCKGMRERLAALRAAAAR